MGEGAVDRLEHAQADGDGVFLEAVEVDEGAHEVLPVGDETHDADGGDGRGGQGDHDVPEDTEIRAAVEAGGLFELEGDGLEELAHEEDEEGAAAEEAGDDKGLEGVDPAEVAEDLVVGDHGDLRGEHHGGQEDDEPDVAAVPPHAGEGVGDQARGEHLARHAEYADVHGVVDEQVEGEDGQGLGVVLEVDLVGPQARR